MLGLLLQTFRFVGSIFFEPIMRSFLYLIARCSHFKVLKVENWSFWGPPSFLKLAEEATEYLKAENSEILCGAPPQFEIRYGGTEFGAAPAWRNAFISDAYITWGAQGILTAWVYIYFSYACRPKTRWLWAIATDHSAVYRAYLADIPAEQRDPREDWSDVEIPD
jgi:hypothetical protein